LAIQGEAGANNLMISNTANILDTLKNIELVLRAEEENVLNIQSQYQGLVVNEKAGDQLSLIKE